MKNSCLIGCSTQAVDKLVKYKAICSTTITGFTPLKSSQVFQHFPSPLRNRQGKGGLCQLLLHICRGRTQGNILSEMPGEWLVACAYLELIHGVFWGDTPSPVELWSWQCCKDLAPTYQEHTEALVPNLLCSLLSLPLSFWLGFRPHPQTG